MRLSPAQQHAKDNVRRARQAQKIARSTFEAEMEIMWRERSASAVQAVEDALKEAHRQGVPMKQIGEAYGTKDYNTVKRAVEAATQHLAHKVEKEVKVEIINYERFVLTLTNFDDWTDPENGTDAMTGEVTYTRQEFNGDWLPDTHTDVSRAVERELWVDSPLRTEVAKHVSLDSLPDVGQGEVAELEATLHVIRTQVERGESV